MMKYIRHYALVFLAGLIPLLAVSCGGSGGGADDGEARVRYQLELEDGGPECVSRIQYRTGDGDLRTERDLDETDWTYSFYARDGAALYLDADIDCGRVTLSLYLNNSRVAWESGYFWAIIEGTLRVDEENNATFEEN
jgi:hypothetical protein